MQSVEASKKNAATESFTPGDDSLLADPSGCDNSGSIRGKAGIHHGAKVFVQDLFACSIHHPYLNVFGGPMSACIP